MKFRSISILTIGAGLLLAPLAQAQGLDQSLFPPNLARSFKYGSGIAVDDNTLVVVDRGYRVPTGSGCGIDDGAVHIYRRSSFSAPWPSTPQQTLVTGVREGHFGEHVVLRGNTLLIAESRWTTTPGRPDGAIHYYTRPNANANFTLVQTTPGPTTGFFFTLSGLVSNGRWVVAASGSGPEPRVRIYKVLPTGLQFQQSLILSGPPITQWDTVALTNNDILVVAQDNQPNVGLYKITKDFVFQIPSSSLSLTNGPGETDHFYTGQADVRGTDVVLATQRRSTAAPPDDDTTYALRAFSLDGSVITPYGEAEIPSDYNSGDGYGLSFRGVDITRGPSVLANLAGPDGLHTLGFEYAGAGQFDLTLELAQADFNPDAGIGSDTNYTQPVLFDGQHLYVGDIYDQTQAPGMCGYVGGSVRIFDTDFGGNPASICAGEQNVVVKFDPIPGATSFQWWGNGTSGIVPNGFSAQVDYAIHAAQPSVTLGVNLNQAPWWTTRTHTTTATACGVAETFIEGPWFACRGQQDASYYTQPVAGATAYNWSSPGATNITATGNAALVDFATNISSTTVRVGIQLSVPPFYSERTLNVSLSTCPP